METILNGRKAETEEDLYSDEISTVGERSGRCRWAKRGHSVVKCSLGPLRKPGCRGITPSVGSPLTASTSVYAQATLLCDERLKEDDDEDACQPSADDD